MSAGDTRTLPSRRRSRHGDERPLAVQRATVRRRRRAQRMHEAALGRAGRPMRAALLRMPLAIALIAVLGSGVAGVLYLNTKTDESGMRTEQAKSESVSLRYQIEALHRSIADLGATARIAEQAQTLGLEPAGDATIIVVDDHGRGTVQGDWVQVQPPVEITG